MRDTNLDYFAERLSCWLDPQVLLESVRRLDLHKGEKIPETTLVFASVILTLEHDGGFTELTREFLKRFKIPIETIALLRAHSTVPTSSVWDDLADYRFSGKLIVPPPGLMTDPPLPAGQTPILLLQERDLYSDILMQPLNTLLGWVSNSSFQFSQWSKLSLEGEQALSVFLQHSSPEPFGAWMDATLASYSGFPNIADPKFAVWQNSFNRGYRLTTLVGWDPKGPDVAKIVKAAREVEREMAAETHELTISSTFRVIRS